jgi:hypothetical protein
MKIRFYICLGSLLAMSFTLRAQANLPLGNSGKIEIVEVVEADSLKKEILFENASESFEALSRKIAAKITNITKDPVNDRITCQVKVMIYSQTGVLKKLNGAVTYSFSVEVKDYKYRYTITDLVYHYYKQNRNYEFVDTGKQKNLEETNAPGWEKTWAQCKETTSEKIKGQIAFLKEKMLEKEKIQLTQLEQKKIDW